VVYPTRSGRRLRCTGEGAAGLKDVLDNVETRYEEENEPWPLPHRYLRDLEESLQDDQLQVYLGYVDCDRQTGRIVLQNGDCVYFWQGAIKPDAHVRVPVNDLLNWKTMTTAIDNGASVVDIVGANTRRLCEYKAKYNPQLVEYYSLDRAVAGFGPLVNAYKKLR
jgi:lipid II:glycine glycyltransferase (peptidoglycan interpeptide bridge formation enzyme)